MLKLMLILSAVRTLFKLLGRIPEPDELEAFIGDGTIPEIAPVSVATGLDNSPAGRTVGWGDSSGRGTDTESYANAPGVYGEHTVESLANSTGNVDDLLGGEGSGLYSRLAIHRRWIIDAMTVRGVDPDAARAAVYGLSVAKLLSLILKYGPDIVAIAKAIIADIIGK